MKNRLLTSLLKVMLLVLVAITAFEYAKYIIFPGLTVYYSHLIGIVFGVMIVGVTAYRVQKTQEKLLTDKIEETEKRLQAEASRRDTEEKYHKLFIESLDGVCHTSIDGKIVEANQAFCDIIGGDADGIIGESVTQFYGNPEDRKRFRDAVAKNKGVKNYEIVQKRKDGQPIICSVSSSYCYSQNGEMDGYLTIVRDITEHKRMEDEIFALSMTDQLTGLHNRRGFLSLAGQQIKLAERNKIGIILFFADLDGLKWINDTLGHEEGDKALIEAAAVLKETFRSSDIIARLGGDEYAALTVDLTTANSEIVTARLQSLVEMRNNQENRRYMLSISVGYSSYDPENPSSIDELMASADKAMYEHKQSKKGLLKRRASLSSI